MVFDPSEFEGPSFDLYICKMLISIFSWFFHTIFKDLTEQILYPNATECTNLRPSEKQFSGRGGWGGEALDTLATAFSLSRVGMYA
jgi:hypothetical protein